jgi:hypothetical protein
MTRKTFLSLVSLIASVIGVVALLAPAVLLDSKGVAPSPAADVWVREVGVAILSTGVMAFLMRGQGDSSSLRAFLLGSMVLQLGLLPIEIIAFRAGIITKISGIVPNEILHAALAFGFGYFAWRMKEAGHGAPSAI